MGREGDPAPDPWGAADFRSRTVLEVEIFALGLYLRSNFVEKVLFLK